MFFSMARSKFEKNGKPNIFTIFGRYKAKGHKQNSNNRPFAHRHDAGSSK
jgi:hypothetical protein